MLFKLQLVHGDYLADKLGLEPIQVQICLDENETLTLYRVIDRYYWSDKDITFLGKNVIQNETKSLTLEKVKILDLASVVVTTEPQFKWVTTNPRFEFMADELNKYGKLSPSFFIKFDGLIVNTDTVHISNRILCKKQSIGNRLLVGSVIKKEYEDVSWIKALVNQATRKMLQVNVTEIKKQHIPTITSRTEEDKIAHRLSPFWS